MRKRALIFIALAALSLGFFWLLTIPKRLDPNELTGLSGDIARGQRIFDLAGCASCHAQPGAEGAAKLVLSGGKAFATPFGTLLAPNITPDKTQGIGGWSAVDLVNAMKFGTSPDGHHYYPAFPYTSYGRMAVSDIVDLKVYLDTLPPSDIASKPHKIAFPFTFRRGLGLWKQLFVDQKWVVPQDTLSPEALRGRSLVEGAGHCGDCHTPRGRLGNILTDQWLKGAPNPTGKGTIPALSGHEWSAADLAEYLKSGFTPEFDTAGGEMVDVIENTAKLGDEDRAAIAAYLKALPPN